MQHVFPRRATLAIVGRANVGKSTLFNRLVGRRMALVDDRPGVTRDRREADGDLFGLALRLVDTAGFEDDAIAELSGRMRAQSEQAAQKADIVLFVVDARAGLTPMDEEIARWLRTAGLAVILVANKAEGGAGAAGVLEAYRLGWGEALTISAEHGEGMDALFTVLTERLSAQRDLAEDSDIVDGEAESDVTESAAEVGKSLPTTPLSQDDSPLKLAVIGRPNAGKSTLINRIIGSERLIVGPEAGITRDSIRIDYRWRVEQGDLHTSHSQPRKGENIGKQGKTHRRRGGPKPRVNRVSDGNGGFTNPSEGDIALDSSSMDRATNSLDIDSSSPSNALDRPIAGDTGGGDSTAIATDVRYYPLQLIDTAGMRKRARITDRLEKLSVSDTLAAISSADVVILLLDAAEGLGVQDLRIANRALDAGCALIIALNKWDCVAREERAALYDDVRADIDLGLAQSGDVPLVTLSAVRGKGVERVLRTAFAQREIWSRQISTGRLNRWFATATAAHPPPMSKGQIIKLRYITQIDTRPPQFLIFGARTDLLPQSYIRYLSNGLRRDFGLTGVPIQISFRKSHNPYVSGSHAPRHAR